MGYIIKKEAYFEQCKEKKNYDKDLYMFLLESLYKNVCNYKVTITKGGIAYRVRLERESPYTLHTGVYILDIKVWELGVILTVEINSLNSVKPLEELLLTMEKNILTKKSSLNKIQIIHVINKERNLDIKKCVVDALDYKYGDDLKDVDVSEVSYKSYLQIFNNDNKWVKEV